VKLTLLTRSSVGFDLREIRAKYGEVLRHSRLHLGTPGGASLRFVVELKGGEVPGPGRRGSVLRRVRLSRRSRGGLRRRLHLGPRLLVWSSARPSRHGAVRRCWLTRFVSWRSRGRCELGKRVFLKSSLQIWIAWDPSCAPYLLPIQIGSELAGDFRKLRERVQLRERVIDDAGRFGTGFVSRLGDYPSCSESHRSASSAAMHPVPAAVTA